MFLKCGIGPTSMQFGLDEQVSPIGSTIFCTKVLCKKSQRKSGRSWTPHACREDGFGMHVQDRVPDEQNQYTQGDECQAANVD